MISNKKSAIKLDPNLEAEVCIDLKALSNKIAFTAPAFERHHHSGIESLDSILGQSVSSGQMLEWCGADSSGKTGLLRALISSVRRRGIPVVWIDSARSLIATDWSEPMRGPLWVIRPPRRQDALFCAEAALRTQSFGIVVLDGAPSIRRSLHLRLQRLARKSGSALVVLGALEEGQAGIPWAQKRIRVEPIGYENTGHLSSKGPLNWRIEARDTRGHSGRTARQFSLHEPRSNRLLLGRPVRDRPGRQGASGERYGR